MGKRELLLVLVFLIVGFVVYQVSAPPAKSGGLSIGDFARRALREMRSENASAELKHEAVHEVADSVEEIRVRGVRQVILVGERRTDIATQLAVNSTGVDKAEAERLAAATGLKVDQTPESVAFSIEYPVEGRQTARLTIRVPEHLRARIEEAQTQTEVSNLAGVSLAASRGEVTLRGITGPVEGDHRGGRLEIKSATRVRLTVRSVDLRLDEIAGPVTLDVTGGEVRMGTVSGTLEIDARSAEIDAERVGGPVRVNVTGGSVTLGGLQDALRCESRNSDLRFTLAKPAALTVFATGGELVVTVPPEGGVTIDAAVTDGELRLSALTLTEGTEGQTRRASGKVGKGGPVISMRSTGGTIVVRRGGES